MKVQVVLPLTLLTSVFLVGFIKIRKKEYDKEDKQKRFQDIKLRVTTDVLQEYQSEKAEKDNALKKTQDNLRTMDEEVEILQSKEQKTRGDLDICRGAKKTDADQLAVAETNVNNIKAESAKEMTDLKKEMEELKKQLAGKSAVCDFLKEKPDPVKEMCGIKVEESPQEEAPKQEVKKEAPKQEEKKEEAPKQEEIKEAPKQEEKKEAPKQEEKKEEAPKQEEKKEAPKQEEKKEEAPKQEEKKEEAPKQEEKKEAPEQEAKAEAKN